LSLVSSRLFLLAKDQEVSISGNCAPEVGALRSKWRTALLFLATERDFAFAFK
jgi:hypothetical protein